MVLEDTTREETQTVGETTQSIGHNNMNKMFLISTVS